LERRAVKLTEFGMGVFEMEIMDALRDEGRESRSVRTGTEFRRGSRAAGLNIKRRIESMENVKRHTKLSLIGRAITGAAVAALLAVGFALPIFTHDRAEASRPLAGQSQKIEPMSQNMRPTILYKEKAQYTEEAKRNGLEGRVTLDAVFADDGNITNIQVYSGLPDGLTEKAIEAAKKIQFRPATRDGKPVSVRGKLEFDFKLYKSGDDSTAKQAGATASETVHAMSSSLRPTITYKEQADYTPEARDKNVQGTVVLSVVFGADGKIGAIRVVSGLPYGLTEKAIEAARAIRFDPAMKDGKPVSVRGNLEFGFSL
jgi:TonB family protein